MTAIPGAIRLSGQITANERERFAQLSLARCRIFCYCSMLLGFCWWETTVASGRKWLEQGERAALVEACRQVDPGQTGRIPISAMGKVLGAVGSEVSPFSTFANNPQRVMR